MRLRTVLSLFLSNFLIILNSSNAQPRSRISLTSQDTTKQHTNVTGIITPNLPLNLTSVVKVAVQNTTSEDCTKRKLSPNLWMDLKMNEYLEKYPQGKSLSLESYAKSVGAENFKMKIGTPCRVEQLCNGISGQDWYALVAAQRWNVRMNQAYDAVAFASTIATEITQAMSFDFVPPPTHILEYISTSISATFWVILAIPGVWFGPVGKYYYRGVLSVFYATTGIVRPISTFKFPTSSPAFSQWSETALLMSQVKKNVQGALVNITSEVAKAGIGTQNGLYGLNTDGQLFSERSRVSENEMQKNLEKAHRLQALSHLWKLQNLFITRGSDPCDGNGENGARVGSEILSYCTPDGIMLNIIRAKGNKVKSKIFGGEGALAKHGFTVKDLTLSAWECQQRVGRVVEPTSWQKATDLENETLLSESCMFVLPVCDLTRSDIRKKRDSGASTVVACREVGGLSI